LPSTVLILTQAGDTHAYAVEMALRERGAKVLLWHTTDFPSRQAESVHLDSKGREQIWLGGHGRSAVRQEAITSVWRRRPSYVLDRETLHPADRAFSDRQCRLFRSSLFDVLAPEAMWANHPDAALRASRKIAQHRLAARAGLTTPRTLYSNDPAAIRAFLRKLGGTVVYKPFQSMPSGGADGATCRPAGGASTEPE
jgi:hypothetical protein